MFMYGRVKEESGDFRRDSSFDLGALRPAVIRCNDSGIPVSEAAAQKGSYISCQNGLSAGAAPQIIAPRSPSPATRCSSRAPSAMSSSEIKATPIRRLGSYLQKSASQSL